MRQGQAQEAADLVPRHGHLHGLRLAAAALPEEAAVRRHALGQRQRLGPLEGSTWFYVETEKCSKRSGEKRGRNMGVPWSNDLGFVIWLIYDIYI